MKNKKILRLISILLILVATAYLIYNCYKEISYKNNQKFKLESYSKQYNNDGNKVIKTTKKIIICY